jgi:transcriptional regulator with XRE-family HTH domain
MSMTFVASSALAPGRKEVRVMDASRPHPIAGVLAMREISKNALAEALGYTRQYTSLVVLGRVPATVEFRRRAAAALDMPEDELFRPSEGGRVRRPGSRGLKQVAAS